MNAAERTDILAQTELFRALSRDALLELGARASDRAFDAGEPLYRRGDPAEELFVVASGAVELSVDRSGGEDGVSTRRPGEVFGEAALYDDGPRMVSARAVEDSDVVSLPAASFRQVVRDNPDVAEALVRLMASVIRRTTER
jgi:CRP-like cAMP-binding protein